MLKRLLSALLVIFALFFLLTDPAGAAEFVRGIGEVLGDLFASIITFFKILATGE